jgi:prepilin-type N-terminal cleavage/methylation domain-containing protein
MKQVSKFITKSKQFSGFTIVELLIVIVVIAILAAISVVASQFKKAISAARIATGDRPLQFTTLSTGTAGSCMSKPAGTDLATLDKATDSCWVAYNNSLQRISNASGININNLTDPWGRPYVLDENEQENTGTYGPCGLGRDYIGTFRRPLTGDWASDNVIRIPYVTPGC